MTPRLFTIPAGAPFLTVLADALLAGTLVPASDLGEAVVTVPTRGAADALLGLLAARADRPLLLPRVAALGEVDGAALDPDTGPEDGAPALPPVARRLILTRLVQAWAQGIDRDRTEAGPEPFRVPASPADAVALAAELEGLMDALTVEGVPWADIAGAVEAGHSRYFGLTLDFLRIAAEHWPPILMERGASDPAALGRARVMAEAARLARERPGTPVVLAGSMGSVPATLALAAAVAGLPRGAVVLPGLDLDLDEAGWEVLGEGEAHGHPQALMRRLLDRLGADRGSVRVLGPVPSARARLLSAALRPAETTDRWADTDRLPVAAAGTADLTVVEAADEREEALAAAVALREALEVPGRTAMLVTPDRGLAVRVAAELRRWDVRVEDGAGTPLAETAAGRFARLAADVAARDAAPAAILALIAHPWVRLGLDRAVVERAAAALEIGVLRGPAPEPGFAGLARATTRLDVSGEGRVPRPRRRLGPEDRDLATDLVRRLADAFAGFAPWADAPLDLVALAARHRDVLHALAAPGLDPDPSARVLDALFDDLALSEAPLEGRLSDYPAFFTALARDRVVPPAASHPRLRILGPVEARLAQADRVVLAGLDEGVWPPRAETDAFLNRPMRARVGLDPPERRIGLSAHDFVQGASITDAVVTRAMKRGGAPTVASRFLQRLKAFAGPEAWAACIGRGERLRGFAAALDRGPPMRRVARPAPRPDPALFPRTLGVAEIETLLLDPYAVYARHVLGLDPLAPVAALPGAAERGILVHAVLGGFAADHPAALPPDAEIRLHQRAQNTFGALADAHPALYAEWWPRFERLAAAYLAWEAARRPGLERVHADVPGRLVLPEGLTLTARADRIESGPDGPVLVDYKTGAVPSGADVAAGLAPALTLQAAMLARGAFRGLPAAPAAALLHVLASGGREPFVERPVRRPEGVAALAEAHLARLRVLVARYLAGEAAYPSRPFPRRTRASSYDHLARVREWSLAEDAEEG